MNRESHSYHLHLKEGEKPSKKLHKEVIALGKKYGVKVNYMHDLNKILTED